MTDGPKSFLCEPKTRESKTLSRRFLKSPGFPMCSGASWSGIENKWFWPSGSRIRGLVTPAGHMEDGIFEIVGLALAG